MQKLSITMVNTEQVCLHALPKRCQTCFVVWSCARQSDNHRSFVLFVPMWELPRPHFLTHADSPLLSKNVLAINEDMVFSARTGAYSGIAQLMEASSVCAIVSHCQNCCFPIDPIFSSTDCTTTLLPFYCCFPINPIFHSTNGRNRSSTVRKSCRYHERQS